MKKVLKEILNTSLYLFIVLCGIYVVIHFIGQRTQVVGQSMESTLSNNDNLIVDKLTYQANQQGLLFNPNAEQSQEEFFNEIKKYTRRSM